MRHSEGNYEDNLDDLGRFTYQPPTEHHGLLEDKKATCHPGFVSHLSSQGHTGEKVVIDGNCIASRGAGTSIDFAFELLALLAGKETKQNVKQGLALIE